jgi:hypothetical protein
MEVGSVEVSLDLGFEISGGRWVMRGAFDGVGLGSMRKWENVKM